MTKGLENQVRIRVHGKDRDANKNLHQTEKETTSCLRCLDPFEISYILNQSLVYASALLANLICNGV